MQLSKPELTVFRTGWGWKSLLRGLMDFRTKINKNYFHHLMIGRWVWPLQGSGGPREGPRGPARPLWPALDVQPRPGKPLSHCTPDPKTSHASKSFGKHELRRPGLPGQAWAPPGRRLRTKRRPGVASEARAGLTQHPRYLKPSGGRAQGLPPCGPAFARAWTPRAHRVLDPVGALLARRYAPGQRGLGSQRFPGAETRARPAALPLPARHSAPRADTARGAAEPSRRAASAPDSPWPHWPGRGETRLAASGRSCAAGAGRTQAARPPRSGVPAARSLYTTHARGTRLRSGEQRRQRRGLRASGRAGWGRGGAGRRREGAGPGACDAPACCCRLWSRQVLFSYLSSSGGRLKISVKIKKRWRLMRNRSAWRTGLDWCIWKVPPICHSLIQHYWAPAVCPGFKAKHQSFRSKTQHLPSWNP